WRGSSTPDAVATAALTACSAPLNASLKRRSRSSWSFERRERDEAVEARPPHDRLTLHRHPRVGFRHSRAGHAAVEPAGDAPPAQHPLRGKGLAQARGVPREPTARSRDRAADQGRLPELSLVDAL